GDGRYRMPLFLLRPPADPALPFRFAPPSLAAPVSQLCTHEQFLEPAYARWCAEIGQAPDRHRKQWEFCYILSVLESAGMLRDGARGLGFGTGREPLPSVFAQRGMTILATDAPATIAADHGWSSTGQHSAAAPELHHAHIVPHTRFLERVTWREVDMNAIPRDLDAGFDFCWSACSLEHLGSIGQGLDFVANSLRCLRPGGLAVHTTEFNLTSNDITLEHPQLVLFRRADIERLMLRLLREGHEVWPLNLHPGFGEVDEVVDAPPFGRPHLKVALAPYVATSIGLVVRRQA
ncbi:MAG TPA: class I SAM-dependent methyltransferase, partial [Acetobacteraceae bacterium]|nr:class I SAM-dependent methyltransferase [Acetobacteraceae bacterium]